MKYFIIIILQISILTSCTYRPKEKRLTKFKNNEGHILKSFYKKVNDTIEFKRLLTSDSELIIQSGKIFFGEYALTHQQFTDVQKIGNDNGIVDSLTTLFAKDGHVSKMTDDRGVMFIQIIPDSAMGNIDALRFLNLRQELEGKIDARLQRENLGEWFAGGMGAGGNMLFFINDWDRAFKITMQVLQEENLIDHVLIAKRIMTTKKDWNYEIIYPLEYEGVFNQM